MREEGQRKGADGGGGGGGGGEDGGMEGAGSSLSSVPLCGLYVSQDLVTSRHSSHYTVKGFDSLVLSTLKTVCAWGPRASKQKERKTEEKKERKTERKKKQERKKQTNKQKLPTKPSSCQYHSRDYSADEKYVPTLSLVIVIPPFLTT